MLPQSVALGCDLFGPVEGRRVAADFDGGAITSDAGGLGNRATLPIPPRQ